MPELPEVETVVRDLRPLIVGRRIERIAAGSKALRQKWRRRWEGKVEGQSIAGIRRRGKWIIVDLDTGTLLVHLGMTGQFTSGPLPRPVESHTHWRARLDGGVELRFRDPRRFGSVAYFGNPGELDEFLNARLGPEPFDVHADQFRASLAATSRSLKAVLLDQSVVAGVGNIYADESLFMARLKPHQIGRDTSAAEADRLLRAIVRVLKFAIGRRGSTIRDYVGGSGLNGEYQNEFRVYGRDGQPCPRCCTPIALTRLAGRATHYCPKCQRRKRAGIRGQGSGIRGQGSGIRDQGSVQIHLASSHDNLITIH